MLFLQSLTLFGLRLAELKEAFCRIAATVLPRKDLSTFVTSFWLFNERSSLGVSRVFLNFFTFLLRFLLFE